MSSHTQKTQHYMTQEKGEILNFLKIIQIIICIHLLDIFTKYVEIYIISCLYVNIYMTVLF